MMMVRLCLSLTLLVFCFGVDYLRAVETADPFDIVIKGGRVVDGSGTPWFVADVGVRAGRIAAIGQLDSASANEIIDASGLIVAPGFIDMRGQSATPLLEDPSAALNLLNQGITTISAGVGSSAAPLDAHAARRSSWRTMAEYFQILDLKGLPVNVVQTVGLTQIRKIVVGEEDRRPTEAELDQMKCHVREAMNAGAIGVSTALIYPPAVFARTDETTALVQVAGELGGRYYTHIRNEGDKLLEAINEAIDVGRTAATPVHIFHLKAAGKQNWNKMQLALDRIAEARRQGEAVSANAWSASCALSLSEPRDDAALPGMFSRFVRQRGPVSLEQSVSQASAAAANEIMAYDRGRISPGLAADLIVFDYQQLLDRATPSEPKAVSEGMKFVLVKGVVVLRDGKQTAHRPGRVLRGPGYDVGKAPKHVLQGIAAPGLEVVDQIIGDQLAKNGAPGASVAITDQGRLIYARGFGYADVATAESVKPTSLFRIASITKPLTAVAIMQLVEAERLRLEDLVYSILDEYEPHLEEGIELDKRQNDITIRHLLQHRGGWDRGISFDGMFQSIRFANALGTPPPAGHEQIIRCMRGVPLDFAPGERYAYSNYGYCLLGRVIEKVSGQTYQAYVQEHLLQPLGITDMAIGRTHLELRQPKEVRYYDSGVARSVYAADLGQRVASPYGAWYLESMDSHGAWIASATDLVRFASALDNSDDCPLLSRQSIQIMFERPEGLAGFQKDGSPLQKFYAAGWQVECDQNGQTRYEMHGGSLPGTSTRLVRRSDGRNFAVLFNARETSITSRLADPATDAINRFLDTKKHLPDINYFSK